ncbi:MAG: pimeloyl-ACP methyl ester carboxylesterase [Candidatus Azotimanducaceae bacterium]|jgi:pimeloyl-ACP methyl ester carboxylesterase
MSQLTANGIQLEYEALGDARNPTMVLIRGLGTQMVDWHPDLLEQLVQLGLHVVIFDNRDVGLSEKFDHAGVPSFKDVLLGTVPAPYTLSDMAADVVGLLDNLGIAKAHILGISLGGMIAQVLSAEYPARVISLLSVMSTSGKPDLPGPTDAAVKAFNAPPAITEAAAIQQTAEHKVVFGSPGYPESIEERIADATRSFHRSRNPDGPARQRLAVASQSDRTALLSKLDLPTTVIHGVDDSLIPIACGENTAALISNATFVAVAGMGHNIPRLLVPEFVGLVKAHLDRVT